MNDEFLTRVSFAGVPHTLAHDSDISKATLYPMTPEDVCKVYWTLFSLTVSYVYSINGVQISRDFSTTSSAIIPKDRLIAPAIFEGTDFDSQTQTSYTMALKLDTVYFNMDDNAKVGLKLIFEEADSANFINLCLRPIAGMNSVAKEFTFLNTTFVAYLNYQFPPVVSASLSKFTMIPEFVVI
ncbi:MAG: hypothetical protein LBB16_02540 [Puniceicoccales bacterium]|jgi:hypothetical protein|nr:hypothetical protein [Puniceicoccales bacterium]